MSARLEDLEGEARREVLTLCHAVADHEEPCHYDHHGYCQAHFLHERGNCPVELAKAYIKRLEGSLN